MKSASLFGATSSSVVRVASRARRAVNFEETVQMRMTNTRKTHIKRGTLLGVVILLLCAMPVAWLRNAQSASTSLLLGDTSLAASADSNGAGIAQAFAYTAASSGRISSIHLYVAAGNTATSAVVGVYADSGGKPGTLLTSGVISSPQAAAWNSVAVAAASVTQGSRYWLALLAEGGTLTYIDTQASGAAPSYVETNRSLAGLPQTYVSGNEWNVSPASAYVMGLPQATPTPTPTSSSVAIDGVPCTVTINGAKQTGTCSGTFTPTTPSPSPTAVPTATATPAATATPTATSPPTATPTPAPTVTPSPTPAGSQTLNCAGVTGSGVVSNASLDACGFPSPDTTGVPAGTVLTPSGGLTITTPGTVINALKVSGSIQVEANNVTIENTEVTLAAPSTWGIRIYSGVTGTLLKYDTIHGIDTTATGDIQMGVWNQGDISGLTEDHVYFYNGQRILHGPGVVQNSYCMDNSTDPGAHDECIYEGDGSVTLNHNTLLNPHDQTAAIFLSTDFGPLGTVTVTNNLLAGGGYCIYGGGAGSVGSETITGNHFSKLYWSNCGNWGPTAYMPATYTWSGNVWDDTGQPVTG